MLPVKYKRDIVFISVEQIDCMGKNPGLYIGTDYPNQMTKVASFANKEKADLFIQYLDYILGYKDSIEEGPAT